MLTRYLIIAISLLLTSISCKKKFEDIEGVSVKCKFSDMSKYGETPLEIKNILEQRLNLIANKVKCEMSYNEADSIYTLQLPIDSINIDLFFADNSLKLHESVIKDIPQELQDSIMFYLGEFMEDIRNIYHFEPSTLFSVHIKNKTIVDNIINTKQFKDIFPSNYFFIWGLPFDSPTSAYSNDTEWYVNLHIVKNDRNTLKLNPYLKVASLSDNQFPTIDLLLNKQGGYKMEDLTRANVGKPLAIVIDNKLIMEPHVSSVIENGSISISGNDPSKSKEHIAGIYDLIHCLLNTATIKSPVEIVEIKKNK